MRTILNKLGLATLGLLLCAGTSHAAEITFAGYTDGCFGAACVPPTTSLSQTATLNELTFHNNTTLGGTSSGGNLALTFGTFDLLPAGNDTYSSVFNLRISFTMPAGISGGSTAVYSSTVTGTTSGAKGQCDKIPAPTPCGSVFIDFSNVDIPYAFVDGATSGSFKLTLNDLTVLAGQSGIALTGSISGAQQTTVSTEPPPSTVPEPASLLLLGTGLVGAAARMRARRKNKK